MTLDEKIEQAKKEIKGPHKSADGYQAAKDFYWQLVAMKRGTTYAKVNPMGFWHSVMSN